jgi:acetyl-CoA carboxylase carboxyl transferase subunit alpha
MSHFAKVIDGIVKEPLGGAHQNPEMMATTLKAQILTDINQLKKQNTDELIASRIDKFCAMGLVVEN